MSSNIRSILISLPNCLPRQHSAHETRRESSQMRRYVIAGASLCRAVSTRRMASTSTTPVEDAIRRKVTEALNPTNLTIRNDSHLHSHHKAMAGSTSKETHFFLDITSPSFQSKPQPARHRMIYSLLKEELDRPGGIHALQLRTKTPEEVERELARQKDAQGTAA